jgi:hypothetical protein
VNATSTSVNVLKGQVQVADFRSGQIAQVMPGQQATALARGNSGLSLSGSGTFSPIQQGQPRAPSIDRVPVPRSGLTAPRHAANARAIGQGNAAARASLGKASLQPQRNAAGAPARHGATRITSALGEVRLNFHRVTHGLARGTAPAHGAMRNAVGRDTVWNSRNSAATAIANGSSNSNDAGSSNANAAAGGAVAASGMPGAIAAAASLGGGNGNSGNSDNGYSNANNGNGDIGSGNGANGSGNGRGRGRR